MPIFVPESKNHKLKSRRQNRRNIILKVSLVSVIISILGIIYFTIGPILVYLFL